ncbi:unnamed protein product [Trichogramma brassicae]|uniref:Uncharacterized protein n=1 Tax=Trichogramma brassicae TaxID=86971 RepID=A0A6H5HWA7_9HYME|nr:unnamed protein product [Trichogramma brassicae]
MKQVAEAVENKNDQQVVDSLNRRGLNESSEAAMNRDRLLRALCLLDNSESPMDWNDEVNENLTFKPPKTKDEDKHAQTKRAEKEKAQREEEERLMREREKEERAKLDYIEQAKLELAENTQNPLANLPTTTTPASGTTFAESTMSTSMQASLYAAQMGAVMYSDT